MGVAPVVHWHLLALFYVITPSSGGAGNLITRASGGSVVNPVISNGNGRHFAINFCSAISGDGQGFVAVETKSSTVWPTDKFCLAVAEGAAGTGNYNFTLQVFNDFGPGTGKEIFIRGHPGVAFNVHDSMNYDFIYFQIHVPSNCYCTGYVQENIIVHKQSSSCPQGPPKGRKWFTVHLQVADRSTRVFLDGVRVVTIPHHHDNIARGGVIVPNGHRNQVFFRGYSIKFWDGSDVKVADCTAHRQGPEYNTLEETSGKWPGFCRALLGSGIAGTKYRLSVDLYNLQGDGGINRGRPGVVYNAQDIHNYDIVYFRPEDASICFQTYYVRHGHLKEDGGVRGRCPDGPPVGRRWFNIQVLVDGATAAIYKDGVLVHNAQAKLQPMARGGVIVGHGYKNIVRYKNLQISAQ